MEILNKRNNGAATLKEVKYSFHILISVLVAVPIKTQSFVKHKVQGSRRKKGHPRSTSVTLDENQTNINS